MKQSFKKLNGLFSLIVMVMALGFISCSEDSTTPTIVESDLLIKYLETDGGDYINATASNIVTATEVKTNITADATKYLVIDVRDTATFAKGHIAGAVNVPFAGVYNYFKANDLTKYTKVYMVCFSGQSAAYSTGLLRLAGYNNVYSMKYGMASWATANMATWKNSVGNAGASIISQTNVDKPAAGALPTITTGKTTGKDILLARVEKAFADGFPSVAKDIVIGTLTNYHIAAYWTLADYNDPGHLPGAPCYVPKTDLKSTGALKTLPTNKTIAIYCYTGHTAAYAAAFLKVMGYDVKSISFGGNAMFYDLMVAKGKAAWKDTDCMGYEVVTK